MPNKITQRQKELLLDLYGVIAKISAECYSDPNFSSFINGLGVFDWSSGDLSEIQDILLDNVHPEQF